MRLREPRRVPAAGAGPGRRSSCAAASPLSQSGGHTSMTSTSRPACRSRRAATRPSPPLLPLPQTIDSRPAGRARRVTPREPLPRALHQLGPGDAAILDRPAVDPAHRLGVQQRLQPARPAHCATATAPADRRRVRQRDLDLDSELIRSRARAAGEPHPRRPAAAEHLDVLPAPRLQGERLRDSFLGAEPGRQVHHRASAAGRVGALAFGEEPLGEPRTARQGALEALDLQEVDPDPGHRSARLYLPCPVGRPAARSIRHVASRMKIRLTAADTI